MIKLRGHHIDVIAEAYFNQFLTSPYPCEAKEVFEDFFIYTAETMKKSKEFKKLLLSNPDLKVEIVNGVDSICELCNNHPESNPERKLSSEFKCSEDDRSDQLSLYEYGLEIGKVYTMRQIIEKIEAFKERSGTRSPRAFRDRFFDPNKVMDYLKEYFKNEN